MAAIKKQGCERQDEIPIRAAITLSKIFSALTNRYEALSHREAKPQKLKSTASQKTQEISIVTDPSNCF